jgi:hypothetical protein
MSLVDSILTNSSQLSPRKQVALLECEKNTKLSHTNARFLLARGRARCGGRGPWRSAAKQVGDDGEKSEKVT